MSTLKSRGAPQNDRLDMVRSQLERETAELLAQRRSLEGNFEARPEPRSHIKPLFTESAGLTPIVHREQLGSKTQEVVNRLQQIIRLCKEEGGLSNEQMREIVKVETQVLNYLQRANGESQLKVVKPYSDTPQADKKNIQSNQTWGKPQSHSYENMNLSQDTLEMIAEIQRKALTQIIHLQKERDTLKAERDQALAELSKTHSAASRGAASNNEVDRLREENRLLKQQNHAISVRLQTIGGSMPIQRPEYGGDYAREGLSSGQYSSQIAVYQNQLKRASVVIAELKSRLSNVAGLDELHEQGERIRRQTAELLQYKSRNLGGEDYAVLRELQERLEEEERGKAAFFEEIRVFKQKFAELQQENRELKRGKSRVNYNSVSEAASARGIIKKRSGFGDYQNTLNELKQALR